MELNGNEWVPVQGFAVNSHRYGKPHQITSVHRQMVELNGSCSIAILVDCLPCAWEKNFFLSPASHLSLVIFCCRGTKIEFRMVVSDVATPCRSYAFPLWNNMLCFRLPFSSSKQNMTGTSLWKWKLP